MNEIDLHPTLEKLSPEIANFSVGFVTISVHKGIQDAVPAGSGTLVTVGPTGGILTAAHVLRHLPNEGQIGLVRYPRVARHAQRATIDMGVADKLMIGTDDSPTGPDLGFLRLPPTVVGDLQSRNVFFNLDRRREEVLSGPKRGGPYFDGISGMIAEWTEDLPDERSLRVKGFRALYGVGLVEREYENNGFDLYEFETQYGPGSVSPRSYGGMSGGGLWRVYCVKDDDHKLSVVEKRLIGVAFYESGLSDGKNIVTCHGPKSVYGALMDAIYERWPGDAS